MENLYSLDEALDYLNEGLFSKKDPNRVRIMQKICLNLTGFFLKNGFKCNCYGQGGFLGLGGNYSRFTKTKTDNISILCIIYGYNDPAASTIRDAGLATASASSNSDDDAVRAIGTIAGTGAAIYGATVNNNAKFDVIQQASQLLLNNEDEVIKCVNKGISNGKIELDGINVTSADRFEVRMYYHHK